MTTFVRIYTDGPAYTREELKRAERPYRPVHPLMVLHPERFVESHPETLRLVRAGVPEMDAITAVILDMTRKDDL